MTKLKIAYSVLVVLGAVMFVFGGYDDSPGAQAIGAFAVLLGIWGLFIRKNRKSK